jgi:hypothetical protein
MQCTCSLNAIAYNKEKPQTKNIFPKSIDGICHIPYRNCLVTITQKAHRLKLAKSDTNCE